MDEVEPAGLSARAHRAIALIAAALVVMAGGVAIYLWSSVPHPYSGPPPPPTSQPIPVSMDWRTGAEGWIVVHDAGGPESVLFHTADAGARWERQFEINGPAYVRFTDARNGTLRANAAQAAGAQLLQTVDGGARWRPVVLPQPVAVSTPFFLDRSRGWLMSGTTVFGTVDGGATWRALSSVGSAGGLAFVPGGTGWLFGGPVLLLTRDGGATWTRQTLPTGAGGPRPSDRLDAGEPTVSADGRGVLPVYDWDQDVGWLYVTADGGATWSDPRMVPGAPGLRRPAFADGTAGWAWDAASAWTTADGGRTWRPAAGLPSGWQFSDIAAASGSQAWATAARGGGEGSLGPARWGLFRTIDGGLHWTRAALPSLA